MLQYTWCHEWRLALHTHNNDFHLSSKYYIRVVSLYLVACTILHCTTLLQLAYYRLVTASATLWWFCTRVLHFTTIGNRSTSFLDSLELCFLDYDSTYMWTLHITDDPYPLVYVVLAYLRYKHILSCWLCNRNMCLKIRVYGISKIVHMSHEP